METPTPHRPGRTPRTATLLRVAAALCATVALGTACADPATVPTPVGAQSAPGAVRSSATRSTGASATGSPSPAACPPSGLRIEPGERDAASGLRVMTIMMRNCGSVPRPVTGYPSVTVLDAKLQPVTITVHQGSSITLAVKDPGPRSFTLQPGHATTATLAWRNTVLAGDGDPATGEHLLIAPTEGAEAQLVTARLDVGNTETIDITAWTAS